MEGVRGQFCGGSLGTAEEKRRVGTGIWTAFGTTDPLSFAGGERISRETGRNSGSALRHFYRGKLPDENEPAVAVIGARECSEYGRYVAEELGQYLGRAGIQVISGMARGLTGSASRQRYLREELPMVCWDAEWISVIPHRIEDCMKNCWKKGIALHLCAGNKAAAPVFSTKKPYCQRTVGCSDRH